MAQSPTSNPATVDSSLAGAQTPSPSATTDANSSSPSEKLQAEAARATQAAADANPEAFYRSFFDHDSAGIEGVKQDGLRKVTSFFNYTIGGLQEIIRIQGEELVLFRTLEHHVNRATLNEEIWNSLSDRLMALRQSAAEKIKSAMTRNSQS